MKAIYIFHLKNEVKSLKSIVVSSIFLLISFLIANYSHSLSIFNDGNSPAIETMFGIYALIVFLFSAILFSNIITNEVSLQTIRYVTPYISRRKLYLTKFLFMLTYFILLTFFSLIILFIIRGQIYFPIHNIFNLFIFYAYIECLILCISSISNNEKLVSLVSMIISFLAPIIFLINYLKENIFIKILNGILPYKYLESNWSILYLIALTFIFYFIGLFIFERKEL